MPDILCCTNLLLLVCLILHRKGAAGTASEEQYQAIRVPSGTSITVPKLWTTNHLQDYIHVKALEDNLSLFILELDMSPIEDTEMAFQDIRNKELNKEISKQAWRQVRADFDLQPYRHPLFTENFESSETEWQVIYEVPSNQPRFVCTYGYHTPHGKVHLILVDGDVANVSRHRMELSRILESRKHPGKNPCSAHVFQWTEKHNQKLDIFIASAKDRLKITGASIAVVRKNGQILYMRGFGTKRIGSNDPIWPDTPFRIGSITKPLTTLMMAKLVEKGDIEWDTPIKNILTNFRVADPDLTKKLTIKNTVSASTGMPRRDAELVFKHKDISAEDRLYGMQHMRPTANFGKVYQYSNQMVAVGGYAAARAYHKNESLREAYSNAMIELVFKPLGMLKSAVRIEDILPHDVAYPHAVDLDGKVVELPLEIDNWLDSIAPAGVAWSTVKDLAQYIVLELNGGCLGDKRIIEEALILERRKPMIKIEESAYAFYGLCLASKYDRNIAMIGHDGNTLGFASDFFFSPGKEFGMVVLTNTEHGHDFISTVKERLIELILGSASVSRAEDQLERVLEKQISHLAALKRDTKLDASFIKQFLPNITNVRFTNKLLGHVMIHLKRDKNSSQSYTIEFGDWECRVGLQIRPNGNMFMLPIAASLLRKNATFLVMRDGSKLILNDLDGDYVFIRNEDDR